MNSDYLINLMDFIEAKAPADGDTIILAGHGANTVGYVVLEI